MMRNLLKIMALGGALAAVQSPAMATSITLSLQASGAATTAAAAGALAASIRSAILQLPANATQADAEAQIVFTIDQAGASTDAAIEALGLVNRAGMNDRATKAIDAVRANRQLLAKRGTGTTAGTSRAGTGLGPAFNNSYALGGGSSDYTQ